MGRHSRPLFITLKPDVSADLSCADVTEGGELQQEVVVGEGHLGVGHAAVVTCGMERRTRQLGSHWRRRRRRRSPATSRALTRTLEQKESRALAVQEVSRLCRDKQTRQTVFGGESVAAAGFSFSSPFFFCDR